jgi:Tfp pilus assembly protein PilV
MRSFIFALAAIVPAFAIDRAGAADEIPAFDIARNCKAEMADASIGGPASCERDETQAKNQLAGRWSSYSASQKKECVGESATGGEKSSVELLTCLEMSTGHFSTGTDPNR